MENAVESAYKTSVVNLNRDHQRRGLFPATDGGEEDGHTEPREEDA
jgi:hypothetical protein